MDDKTIILNSRPSGSIKLVISYMAKKLVIRSIAVKFINKLRGNIKPVT